MPTPLLRAGGPWWNFKRYEIRDGYIRPAPGARLRQYDPWEKYLETRTGGGWPDPPYRSLIVLLGKVKYDIRQDSAGGPLAELAPESEASITRWCADYGLLGVLTQQVHLVALAPRWSQLPGHSDAICPSQTVHLRANYASQPFRTEENMWGSLVTDVGRRRSGDLVADRNRPSDGLRPGVFLNDLTTASWKQEMFAATWARFFPDVPASERETYRYPAPLSEEFWTQYAEPVGVFLSAAVMFRDIVSRLASGEHTMPKSERAGELSRALEALHGLVAPVSPALAITDDGHLHQRWVGPSLLSAFAMMLVEDLGGTYRVRLCDACQTPMVSRAYQAQYCSFGCRRRLQMQRYRARVRKARDRQARKRTGGRRR